MKLLKFFFKTLKGIYDILASYFLAWILVFAVVAFVFHLLFTVIAGFFEFAEPAAMWLRLADWSGIPSVWLRLSVVVPLQIGAFLLLRKPIQRAQPVIEEGIDRFLRLFDRLTARFPRVELAGEVVFSLLVTALLVPFVVQPTLVPDYFSKDAWLERTANLLDGTATAELADSVVGLYRKLYAEPVVHGGVPREDLDDAFAHIPEDDEASGPVVGPRPDGDQPLMDRWDPHIRKVASEDPDRFAFIKAFMWVESGGRQYAVSHTGCAGLMQFCSGTAKSRPFKKIFGVGQVYTCACRDRACRIDRDVQKELESGEPEALERHADDFPCEMTDARFDPEKIITAGDLYIDRLARSYGGNIYLMYIGYNSGPAVADKVWKQLDENPDATLADIEPVLTDAMRPHYGDGSPARARSLCKTHLPKLKRAFDRYRAVEMAASPVDAVRFSAHLVDNQSVDGPHEGLSAVRGDVIGFE